MTKSKILVIGGYGNVGRVISTNLCNQFPYKIVAAGRNYYKAKKLSLETRQQVLPLALDILNVRESDLMDVSVVVACVDQPDTRFVEQCLHRGIHYISISANHEFLHKIELKDSEAKKHASTVVLSVGLAPGLTNLLASHCQSVFERLEQLDIFIMLGLGEVAGEKSLLWTLKNMSTKFPVKEMGVFKQVKSFEDSKDTIFSPELGRRRAYRFSFSDQQTVAKTLGIDSVSTWICFDSGLITRLFALSSQIALSKALRSKILQRSLIKIFQTFQAGSDKFVIKIEAKGIVDEKFVKYEPSIQGHDEGTITGLVAAKVAEHLYTNSLASGVFHIDQLFNSLEFIDSLSTNSLVFKYGKLKPGLVTDTADELDNN